MIYRRLLFLIFCFGTLSSVIAQNNEIDSLYKLLNTAKHDTDRFNTCISFAEYYQNSDPDTSIYYYTLGQKIADKLPQPEKDLRQSFATFRIGWEYFLKGDFSTAKKSYDAAIFTSKKYENHANTAIQKRALKNIAACLGNIGVLHSSIGEYPKSLDFYFKSLDINKKIENSKGQAANYINIGLIYLKWGNYSKALDYFFHSLEINNKINNEIGKALSLSNIGVVYTEMKDYQKANEYFFKSLKINEDANNMVTQAEIITNIGLIYSRQDSLEKALQYTLKANKISEKLNVKKGQVTQNINIGSIYDKLNRPLEALFYYEKALSICNEISDNQSKTVVLYSLGNIYEEQKQYKKAEQYILQSAALSHQLHLLPQLSEAYLYLSDLYLKTNRPVKAIKMYKLSIQYRDSVYNEENKKSLITKEMQYEFDRLQEQEKTQQALKDAKTKEEKYKQQIITYAISGISVLLLALTVVILRNLTLSKKNNKIITKQKAEVEHQKHLIEEKNKEILDSISYAKRIQEAILPSKHALANNLPNSFVFYKPKDIVAGDFYWLEKVGDSIFFAVADCTGHGVPGAMVSVVCSNALSKALLEENIIETGKLLDRTRELVVEQFSKSEENVQDGMDVSLCKLTGANLEWSGANNPLWIVRKEQKEIEEIKADKQPIGKYDNAKPFTTHHIKLTTGDTIYIFTDGYQDQFGGEHNKKFKTSQLKDKILAIQSQSMAVQKEILNQNLKNWKNNNEQTDDVCVIGVKI